MSDATDTDATDEPGDDSDVEHIQRSSLRCSMDDDDDDDDDDNDAPRILIVTKVPDAVFEEQQAKVISVFVPAVILLTKWHVT